MGTIVERHQGLFTQDQYEATIALGVQLIALDESLENQLQARITVLEGQLAMARAEAEEYKDQRDFVFFCLCSCHR